MRACIQRVSRAAVTVKGQVVGSIQLGLLVLLGVEADDTIDDVSLLARKIVQLRVFEDSEGKMNRSLSEVDGKMLVVSQFTLLGDCRRGRRPSYTRAAPPHLAEQLYEAFMGNVRRQGIEVAQGRFRAHMDVESVNNGPVTLLLDSRKIF